MNLYLMSLDYYDFQTIRKVLEYRYITIDGIQVLKIRTDLSIIGQKYGLGDYNPDVFYLTNKYNNDNLIHLTGFPIAVVVHITMSVNKNPIHFSDLQNIAWAELYNNISDMQADLAFWKAKTDRMI